MRHHRPQLMIGLFLVICVCAFVLRDRQLPPTQPATAGTVRVETLPTRLEELRGRLAGGSSMPNASEILSEMAKTLDGTSRAEAVAALIAVLDSGVDAPTGLAFKVGPGGNLDGAPTLRVWMLDQLSRVDIAAGASYAVRIYARHDSADEWAVALRNDWRTAAPAGRIEPVRTRVLELIADLEWAKQPTVGFLEALDLSVATMAWEAVPRLERWLDPAQPKALRAGAWITLDRLTMEVPSDFLPTLAQHRDWLASQPMLRAGLMARVDLNVERERQAAEIYLQRSDLAAEEGMRFFELLPNVSATVSYNLVTTVRTPSPPQAARLDQAALSRVREWKNQPRFARWKSDFIAAEIRLAESVAAAVRGGYLQP